MNMEELMGDEDLDREAVMESLEIGKRKFTLSDKMILHSFEPSVESIAEIYGENCEVILYSLEKWDHAVVKVVNGHITGRNLDSPLTNLEISILRKLEENKDDVIGSYFVQKENGDMIKASKSIIRNFENYPIGMLCINLNLSAPLFSVMKNMIPSAEAIAPVKPVRYPATPHDLIKQSLEIVVSQIKTNKGFSQVERNKKIVFEMYDIGIFDIKGAIDIMAQEMGVSRYTIYNYIREAKQQTKE